MCILVALLGPTAVGKTELSIRLANELACPIVNCDSRQLYRELRIGTASPTAQQRQEAEHHFVGTLSVGDYYSAARYEEEALALLSRLFLSHTHVILSGGSMLYAQALLRGIDDIPTVDTSTRQRLKARLAKEGLDALASDLQCLDPEYAKTADLRNPRRIVHALEICEMTGRPYSSFRTGAPKPRPFRAVKIGLLRPRPELFERIARRVDAMMEAGLLEEALALKSLRQENALNTVGYKELFAYADGRLTLPEAVERIKKNTRLYAKKQMAWLRADKDIRWFHPLQEQEIIDYIKAQETPAEARGEVWTSP